MRISDWSSDVCSSDLPAPAGYPAGGSRTGAARRPARTAAGGPPAHPPLPRAAPSSDPPRSSDADGGRRRAGRGTATMIPVPSGVRVWLATGYTNLRKGFPSLSMQVQEVLRRDPLSGLLFSAVRTMRGRVGGSGMGRGLSGEGGWWVRLNLG